MFWKISQKGTNTWYDREVEQSENDPGILKKLVQPEKVEAVHSPLVIHQCGNTPGIAVSTLPRYTGQKRIIYEALKRRLSEEDNLITVDK